MLENSKNTNFVKESIKTNEGDLILDHIKYLIIMTELQLGRMESKLHQLV